MLRGDVSSSNEVRGIIASHCIELHFADFYSELLATKYFIWPYDANKMCSYNFSTNMETETKKQLRIAVFKFHLGNERR
jgi:hypothetical protein